MKLLLTGHRGYLGACVATLAQAQGRELLTLDGRLEDLAEASLDCDLVIHCAGALRHRVAELESSNVLGLERLLAALRRPVRFLYVSSRAVYTPIPGQALLSEASPLGPAESYGLTKLAGEKRVQASGLPHCIVRPTLLIGAGEGQTGISFLSRAFAAMAQGEAVTLFEPVPIHDSLAVRDLATWILQLADADPFTGGVYNAAGVVRSLEATLDAWATVLAPLLGRRPEFRRVPATYSGSSMMDSSRLQRLLPLKLATDAEIGLEMARLLGSGVFHKS